MTVGEAFELLKKLKTDKIWYQSIIGNDPYHASYKEARNTIKKINDEIKRLEELIYNQELEDSYDQNGEDI